MYFHQMPASETFRALESGPAGLAETEAARRLIKDGRNELDTASAVNPLRILIGQFKSFIVYVLLFAVAVSVIIGEYLDSAVILFILIMNAAIGFFQEYSAHKSLEALKRLGNIRATVIRDGQARVVDAVELVAGDVIYVESGDKTPADARIIEAVRLEVDESALTGESVPVDKTPDVIRGETPLADRHNMLFSSTAIVSGNGRAVVTATGMHTEIGRITTLIKEAAEEPTPLQRRLDRFGRLIGWAIIGICLCVLLLTSLRAYHTTGLTAEQLLTFAFIAISLAVAAVPTALPAVVTIALSIGVKRLLRRKALVRRLSSVETLGSCDVICTDKTGTLTQNQMTVRHLWTPDEELELAGHGYNPGSGRVEVADAQLLRIGLHCNNSTLNRREGDWAITGDPTEAALLVSARKAGLDERCARLDEIPFDSRRKCMSVLAGQGGKRTIYSKGAPGALLDCCDRIRINGETAPLDEPLRRLVLEQNKRYASAAMRVLGFAYRELDENDPFAEAGLIFVGLQAMIDPPRPDVAGSILRTRQAGIRVIMITGDYLETARAIARQIGIDDLAVTGAELDGMDADALRASLERGTAIFARVVPEHKQRIVTCLQAMGHTVAMTGDGVNDAPALKKADIGVAVGSGTEVAKEAADFVLLDDSFTHVVNAIEEGRGIYDNIQKSIMLLLSGNVGEVQIVFLAALFGMNLPLTAILLLWLNMVTNGAPALAFTVDPYGVDIMRRKPKPRAEPILPVAQIVTILTLGTVGMSIALSLFGAYGGADGSSLMLAQTMVFNFVVLYECILVFIIRHGYAVPLRSNIWVWISVVVSLLLQAMLMYTPLTTPFGIVPLDGGQLAVLFSAGFVFLLCGLLYQITAGWYSRSH
ncbi:MAG: cation-translocating P-type ATPase [Gammaproteobacteria bacterium]|nr:MAG: cation-translocating P-type ATPase [Gammaproteobacteria bacterium]